MWLASSAAVVGLQLGALSLPIEVVEGKESVVELSRLPGIAVFKRNSAFSRFRACRGMPYRLSKFFSKDKRVV